MAKRPSITLQWVLIGMICASVIAVGYTFTRYRKQTDFPIKADKDQGGEPATLVLKHFKQSAVKDGKTQWQMEAVSAKYFNSEKRAVIYAPMVTFYSSQHPIYLKAQEGEIRTDSNDISVTGDVRATTDDYELYTEKLIYQTKSRKFFTSTPVRVVGQSYQLTADSMGFYLDSETAFFKGNVKGIFRDKLSL